MKIKLENVLRRIPFLGRTSEKDALLKKVKDELGGGAVYGCLEAIAHYNNAREAGEEWARECYSTKIDFLRVLVKSYRI